jgi:hypothetical protein
MFPARAYYGASVFRMWDILVFLLVCKRCSWFHSKFFPSCPDRQVQFLRAAHLSQPQGRYGAPVLTKLMVVMKIGCFAASSLDQYQARHRSLARRPALMSRLMLILEGREWFRRRVM